MPSTEEESMRLIETSVMRGPNQWSAEQSQLIVARYELPVLSPEAQRKIFDEIVTRFPAVAADVNALQPSYAIENLVHFLVQDLQTQAGMTCSYARIRPANSPGQMLAIYEYEIERAGTYVARAAEEIVAALMSDADYDMNACLSDLARIKRRYSIGPTTTYMLNEVKRRGIPFRQFEHGSLITLGYGSRQKKIRTAVTDATSGLGIEMAGDKDETKRILLDASVPVPRGIIVYSEEELRARISEVSYPLVVKPLDGNHGRGVTTDIQDVGRAVFGFHIAQRISRAVIVEEFIRGDDYRFLVVNYKLLAVALRMPAHVIGDGRSTIQQLIDETNKDPDRGDSAEHVLALIRIDDVTKKLLAEKNLTLESVLPAGERLILKDTANISAGGTAIDVTDKIHPENKFIAERIARIFNLDICGIDIMATAVDVPLTRETGAVIEVNAGPGLRMHSNPQQGMKRDVASPIIDMLFPSTQAALIPVVAVTGTNGKTTTTRLIAHIAAQAGHKTGYCVSDGIYIDGHLIYEGDCTGAVSAQQVLFDPTIDFAVLECARGGIIRSGLGFSKCDVSVITNIAGDHLGMHDIHTLDDMARVKGVIARSTRETGYAVLNADDNKVYGLYESVPCNKALFTLNPDSDRLRTHLKAGGLAATVEDESIVVYRGNRTAVAKLSDIPLTFGGKATFMVQNVLAAVLAAAASGFEYSVIRDALATFSPSPDHTPGRLNLFDFGDFRLIVDYAHNTDGFKEVKKFVDAFNSSAKTCIVSVAGDRSDDDIRAVGMVCATAFDRIITRDDRNLRGRAPGAVAKLIAEGAKRIDPEIECDHIPDERDAIETAIARARKNELIFVCADKVKQTLELIESLHQDRSEAHA